MSSWIHLWAYGYIYGFMGTSMVFGYIHGFMDISVGLWVHL